MATTPTEPHTLTEPATSLGDAAASEPSYKVQAPAPWLRTQWANLVAHFERREMIGQSLLSIFDQAIVSCTSFVTSVVIGRTSSPGDLGRFYMLLTVVMVLVGLQDAAVAAPFTVFGAHRRGRELAQYTGSMWVQHFVLTIFGTASVLVVIVLAKLMGSAELVPGLWVLTAAVPLILLREGIRRYSFARLRIGTAIAVDLMFCALQVASIAALWYYGHLSVPALFVVMGGASGLACCGWLLCKPGRPLFARDRLWKDWKHNWVFAKWAILSYLAVDTIPYMMPWIIGIAAGAAATGLFGGCATLLGATNILVLGAGNYMRPKAAHAFAAGGVPSLRHVLISLGCVFLAAFGLLSLGFIVTGDWLAVTVYGNAFHGTAGVLIALSFNVLVGSLGFVASSGLWALGQPRSSLLADICMLVATLVAAAFLVVPYGALGAAISALIGTSLGTAVKLLTVHWKMESIRTKHAVGFHFGTEPV